MTTINPVRGGTFVQLLDPLLQQRLPVKLAIDATGALTPRPLGLFERVMHWDDTQFHAERLSALASLIARILAVKQRQTPQEAASDPVLRSGRNLLKQAHSYHCKTPQIETLKKEVTAAKLAITATTLDKNPGLQKFVEKHHLERYLWQYGHSLKVDAASSEVSILKDGTYTPWTKVHEEINQWSNKFTSPLQHWVYGPEGVQTKNMYEWTTLKPFKKGNPAEWNHQYVFEFCACLNPHSLKNGNHSWMRLKTPSGDIYSVGLYRPEKPDLSHNFKTPLRVKPGHLMQPDVSEFWDFDIFTIATAISKEEFFKMKQTIEEDKKNEDQVFQLISSNCLLYCKKIGAIADIDIPTGGNVLNLFTPPGLQERVKKGLSCLPVIIQKVCAIAAAFFVNLILICLGATRIDDQLNAQQRQRAVPHLRSFKDLCDQSKTHMHEPMTFAFKTRAQVLEWRRNQIEALQASEKNTDLLNEQIRKIELSLPPCFYRSKTSPIPASI